MLAMSRKNEVQINSLTAREIKTLFNSGPCPDVNRLRGTRSNFPSGTLMGNWGGKDINDVLSLEEFDYNHADDLFVMSNYALRYYLPAVLVYMLEKPNDVAFTAMFFFMDIVLYEVGIDDGTGLFDEFNCEEKKVFANGLMEIENGIKKYDLDWEEASYLDKIDLCISRLSRD